MKSVKRLRVSGIGMEIMMEGMVLLVSSGGLNTIKETSGILVKLLKFMKGK